LSIRIAVESFPCASDPARRIKQPEIRKSHTQKGALLMQGIATIALAFSLAATPVLAAQQSTGPVRLSDDELAQVTGGGSLPLNLDDFLRTVGQNLGLNVDLTKGPFTVTIGGFQGAADGLRPLLQDVVTLTGQLIQQAQLLSTTHP